jgi:oxygen-independent coproporphyrinogen-3 oxidase
MLPLMRPASPEVEGRARVRPTRRIDGGLADEPPFIELDASRPIIVGVLPHTQCNPRVEGCGFCTFPHDRFDKSVLRLTVGGVADEIRAFFHEHPEMAKRRVDAVYLGGATANLTPAASLRRLCETLASHLDLGGAEVTLEGVPALFRSLFSGPFEVLLEVPARHHRISMGVQTFDAEQLRRMGRKGFGDRAVVSKVVDKAHRAGMTVSGDFLVNLPGEPRTKMLEDVRMAAEMGFDQICIYHLVLTENMGTPWASDPAIIAALPTVADGCDNWLAVRELLLELGFVQTTLTNFERASVNATDRRFVYEQHSFTPELYDALGFGPLSISTFVDTTAQRAVKLLRGKSMVEWENRDLYFPYEPEDLRLLFLTRTLARLRVDRALLGDTRAVEAVIEAGLAKLDARALTLTARGMFYADSVAGLFSSTRVAELHEAGAGRHTRDLLGDRMLVDFMG